MPITQILLTANSGGFDGGPNLNIYGWSDPMNEGSTNTVTVEYANYPPTTLYWQIVNETTQNADWVTAEPNGIPLGSIEIGGNGITTFSWTAAEDLTTEGDQTYRLNVGTVLGGANITNVLLTLADTSTAPPSNGILSTSLLFDGSNERVGYAASDDWVMGIEDFTIEWWGWRVTTAGFQRPFSLGRYPGSPLAVSFESSTGGYLWRNGSPFPYDNPNNSQLINQWVHYAISRDFLQGSVALWVNGERRITQFDFTNFGGSGLPLTIGHENTNNGGQYQGYITDFHWIKGSCKYNPANSTITVPTAPATPTANTKLLLRVPSQLEAFDDFSGTGKSPSVTTGVTWSPYGPF
jgi:hypothetical protein